MGRKAEVEFDEGPLDDFDPENPCKDPVAMLEIRDYIAREKWIQIETAKIIREKLRWCYLIEGINHLQKCKHLVQDYLESTSQQNHCSVPPSLQQQQDSLVIKPPTKKKSLLLLWMFVLVFSMLCSMYTYSVCLSQISNYRKPKLINIQPSHAFGTEQLKIPYLDYPKPYTYSSSNGEIFSVKERWSNVSTIIETLDKVYNLDWFNSASKNECTAAVGFMWVLN